MRCLASSVFVVIHTNVSDALLAHFITFRLHIKLNIKTNRTNQRLLLYGLANQPITDAVI